MMIVHIVGDSLKSHAVLVLFTIAPRRYFCTTDGVYPQTVIAHH